MRDVTEVNPSESKELQYVAELYTSLLSCCSTNPVVFRFNLVIPVFLTC